METAAQRLAQLRSQGRDHDADLQDTLIRATEEADQRLMWILAQDAESRVRLAGGTKHGVGTPRKRLGKPRLRALRIEIMA